MDGGAGSPWFDPRCQFADWLHSWLIPELDSLAGLEHLALVAGYLPHGGTSGVLAGRRRNIPWPAAMAIVGAAGQLNSGSIVRTNTAAELETDHHDHSMMTSNRASNCPHCPGPGNESVGPLAQAYMFLLTGAAENAGRSGVASFLFPTTGAEAEGSVVLADDNQPMTGDRWCFLVETGCPTNGSWRMIHRLGCLTWYPPGPGTAGGRTSGG